VIDIYYFNNPELVNYDAGFVGVRPKDNDYKHWLIKNDVVREVQNSGILYGMGYIKIYYLM